MSTPRSVLVVEDNDDDFHLLTRALPGHVLTHAPTIEVAEALLASSQFDVCLLDQNLNGQDGFRLLQRLNSSGRLPIIVLTGNEDPALERRAEELGAAAFLMKDTISGALIDKVLKRALRDGGGLRAELPLDFSALDILIVEDEALMTRAIVRGLGHGTRVTTCASAEEALATMASGHEFDVILTDVHLGGMTGLEFFNVLLRTHPQQAKRLGFMTSAGASLAVEEALALSGRAVLEKPFVNDELRKFVAAIASTGRLQT